MLCSLGKNPEVTQVFDAAIVGAGVAGLYAAYCCGILGLEACVVDSLMCVGGQCGVLYPEKKVYGVPGFVDATAAQFISNLSEQAFNSGSKFVFGQKVYGVSKTDGNLFKISTSSICPNNPENAEILAKSLVIATGIGDMKPSVPANIKGLAECEINSNFIQYYCMKIDLYKDKIVVIAGGGDSAADFVTNIAPIAKKVILIHRRSKMTCEQHKIAILEDFVEKGRLNMMLERQITEICEDSSGKSIKIKSNSGEEQIYADYIVFCYGFLAQSSNISGLDEMGLEMTKNLINVDINTMQTSIENCYAIGDVVEYPNKKKNIVPCFFEADRAVRSIKSKIF